MLILSMLALLGQKATTLTVRDHVAPFSAKTSATYYALSNHQVLAAKEALFAYLPVKHPGTRGTWSGDWSEGWRPTIWQKIGTYHLLYTGVLITSNTPGGHSISATGVKHVRISGICDDIAKDMRSVFEDAIVTDGGECMFTAIFDPARNKIIYFSVAGIA